jgi:AraC-like DNA-binding protein
LVQPLSDPSKDSSMASTASPLASALLFDRSHQLFASADLDHVRYEVGRVMKPHALDVVGPQQKLNARLHHVSFGDVSLSRLKYGAHVSIVPDSLDDFFLVQMPICGTAAIASGDQAIESTPRLASVLSPTDPVRMQWSADNDQLMVRISRPRLERALTAQLGYTPELPLRFTLGMPWQDLPAWRCLISFMADCAANGIDKKRHALLATQIEQLVVSTLLSLQPHNFSHARASRCIGVLPRHVRKVEEYLFEHADEPITADQLALIAGVSLRSLFSGFKQFCGVTPMQYLKNLRLDRARAALMENTGESITVAGIALRWGFGHLGESPSETLRRAS